MVRWVDLFFFSNFKIVTLELTFETLETSEKDLIHPGRLTWNLQITHLERKMLFQTSMIMFHVNLPGCKPYKKETLELIFVMIW